MCKSKLRTLLFFSFIHFIYLSLAVYFFFFYSSPLKVCHHARCSFSVGSTCKVVGSVGGGFSHIGQLEGERGVVALDSLSGRTLTTLESPKKNKSKTKKKTHYRHSCRGGGVTIIEDSQKVKQKQFSSCSDSFHPIHKRGRFYIMTSSVDIFSAVKKKQAVSLEGR